MIFLGPLYQQLTTAYADKINHFPLIRLVVFSLDKTILYLLVLMLVRFGWRLLARKPFRFWHEVGVVLVSGYVILLLMLTVFRDVYYPWQLHFFWDRPLSVINFTPFTETAKLWYGLTRFDFWYQSLGNVLWFVPLGFGYGLLSKRPRLIGAVGLGVGLSLTIETLQFLLISGVADIDDVIFNGLGAVLGYVAVRLTRKRL